MEPRYTFFSSDLIIYICMDCSRIIIAHFVASVDRLPKSHIYLILFSRCPTVRGLEMCYDLSLYLPDK